MRSRESDLSRFDGLPDYNFDPHWLTVDGVDVHYLDEGVGRPVVLFHGEPTWSFLYRKIIPPLVAAGYRAIAPDYPGFGKSDKPRDPDYYTYDRHVSVMNTLVDHLQLERATAVVQDWGGPIGLRVAIERRDRFDRLVIMNTGLFSEHGSPSPAFMQWRAFVERTPDLPVTMVMGNAAHQTWDESVYRAYEAPFTSAEDKVGAHRFPLIVPLDAGDPGAAEMLTVRDALRSWTDPTLVLFGSDDPIFAPSVGQRLAYAIPGAGPMEVVTDAGHFLQEDQGQVVADKIVAFLQRSE